MKMIKGKNVSQMGIGPIPMPKNTLCFCALLTCEYVKLSLSKLSKVSNE